MSFAARIERACLGQIDKILVGRHAIAPAERLVVAIDRLRRSVGNGHGQLTGSDRVVDAINKAITGGVVALKGRERFVLAYGFSQEVKALGGASVIADVRLSGPLLDRWERDSHTGRLGGGVWRGLFRSYLQASPGPATARLGKLLGSSFQAVAGKVKGSPDWLQAVRRHGNLLSETPCARYVWELAEGERKSLDDLMSVLAPPSPSWFWDALSAAIADQVGALADKTFVSRLPLLLSLLDISQVAGRPSRRNALLGALLERYYRTSTRERHQQLLSCSVLAWGNPQLFSNTAWSSVSESAKWMVCGWIALEDLQDFYSLCQGHRRVDEDRLKYWLRFKDQITFTQIVLGSTLFWSRDSEMREFRERKKGRLAQLTASQSDNNAIIMGIGNWIFVEFSARGNACYCYRTEHLPFSLGDATYSLIDELKDKDAVAKSGADTLTHHSEWQSKFDVALRRWGLYPDRVSGGAGGFAMRAEDVARVAAPDDTKNRTQRYVIPADLLAAVRSNGATVSDLRQIGGALWIATKAKSMELEKLLLRDGFKYRLGRGYHRQ